MKFSKLFSIELIFLFSVYFNFGYIGNALAGNLHCVGADCNDKEPVKYQCDSDAEVVEQLTKTIYRWQDYWQPQQIIVQQMFSKLCYANWTKAYIPDDTFLFIRERDLVNGGQPIHGLFKANGSGYFWVDGNMSNGYFTNQACVALQGIPLSGLGYWYDRYCTGFN